MSASAAALSVQATMSDSLKSTGRRDINLLFAMIHAAETEYDTDEQRIAALLGLTPETLRVLIAANAPNDVVVSTLLFQWFGGGNSSFFCPELDNVFRYLLLLTLSSLLTSWIHSSGGVQPWGLPTIS